MQRIVSYAEIASKYPEETAKVVEIVKAGRSKFRVLDPSDWQWMILWGHYPARTYGRDLEERVKVRMASVKGLVCLQAVPGGPSGCAYGRVQLPEEAVRDWIVESETGLMEKEYAP